MNPLLIQLSLQNCERASLHVSQREGGDVRIALSHNGDEIALRFTTPAEAWKFGQSVSAEAVKLMTVTGIIPYDEEFGPGSIKNLSPAEVTE